MASTDTSYSARFELPDLIEQGRDNELVCRVYRSGALVAPTSGTVSVYNAANQAVVSAEDIDDPVSGDRASYTVPAATLASESRGEGWRVEWTLVLDGKTHVFRNDAALVKARLYPVVTEADLYRRVPVLDPNGSSPLTTKSDFTDYLDEAWLVIQQRLIANGNRPNLVLTPSALREVTLNLWIALIFENQSTRSADAWLDRANQYRERFEAEWDRLRFQYDTNDDGRPDDTSRRGPTRTLWLM